MVAARLDRQGSSTIVHFTGDCEAQDGLDFLEPIVRALRENVRIVVVDLAALSSICRACVDALVKGRRAAERYHAELELAGLSADCVRALEAADAVQLFAIR